jgi:3-phenylpropionate/trans-cinnamate dioxygenase ferredoxin component
VNDAAFVRVAAIVEVPEGEIRGYELPVGHVAVAHLEQELFAFADECPGDGCALSDGDLDEIADAVMCPCDGTAFDLRTGEPVSGPSPDRVALYRVRISEEWIEVGPEIGGRG